MAARDDRTPNRDPLDTERLLWVFFLMSTLLLVVLAAVPFRSHFTEWRELQQQYNRLADKAGSPPVGVGIKQVWNPRRGIVDRCVTCHLGMGEGKPIPGHPVFGPHPAIPHEPAEFGCVTCHLGQGRATTSEDAHATSEELAEFWDTPLVEPRHAQSGCGSCHQSFRVPTMDVVARGRYLFDLHGCLSCHRVDGEGGVVGPDLSAVGLKGFPRDWHIRHLVRPAGVVEGSRMMNFGHLSADELDAIISYMDTLVGAPELMAGKALANTHGCRGCHTIQGVGGDMGPPLDEEGTKPVHKFDFTHVEGERTVASWHRQHLEDPARVVPGSRMPVMDLSEQEVDQLTTYILSLRSSGGSLDRLPRADAVARLTEARDHGTSGEDLYRVYCSACHGEAAGGRVLDQLGTRVPAIGNPDFLAVASDDFLRETLLQGRPGRDMPAWAAKKGGLGGVEVEAILSWLRSLQPQPPSFEEVMAAAPDREVGGHLFRGNCAACHGLDGEGTVVAPSLTTEEFLVLADDRFLYRTVVEGRPGTAMPAHRDLQAAQVRSLMAWIDSHRRRPRVDVSDFRARGSISYGKQLYATQCASCHGVDGGGGVGPSLANQAFLAAASDGFLMATIREGRGTRAMRAFGRGRGGIVELEEREIEDVVTFLRSLETPLRGSLLKGHVQGDLDRGGARFGELCAGCHGPQGRGGLAPALNNPGFLAAASDGFLQATILRGRAGTAMRAWGLHGFAELAPQEVNDITAYIRSWERKDTP